VLLAQLARPLSIPSHSGFGVSRSLNEVSQTDVVADWCGRFRVMVHAYKPVGRSSCHILPNFCTETWPRPARYPSIASFPGVERSSWHMREPETVNASINSGSKVLAAENSLLGTGTRAETVSRFFLPKYRGRYDPNLYVRQRLRARRRNLHRLRQVRRENILTGREGIVAELAAITDLRRFTVYGRFAARIQ
jgi:hypothetical protein